MKGYTVEMLVEMTVQADSEVEAKIQAENEMSMIECDTWRFTSVQEILY